MLAGAEYSEDDVSELVREEPADSPRPPRGRRIPRRPASRYSRFRTGVVCRAGESALARPGAAFAGARSAGCCDEGLGDEKRSSSLRFST